MTRKFRIDLAYDGTDFEGWQTQNTGRTVQGEIQKALERVLKSPVEVIGAGRTDSGVHARSQSAHFCAESTTMNGEHFVKGLNSLLPKDVRILECREVPDSFHARFSALARVYQYYLVPQHQLLPWEYRYAVRISRQPDLRALNDMAKTLKGELDFTTFSHAQDPSASKKRYIYHAYWFAQGDKLVFRVSGNAFLWKMVRSLVGTMLSFAAKGIGTSRFREILLARDRSQAGPTAPPQGLFLHKVIYDEREYGF